MMVKVRRLRRQTHALSPTVRALAKEAQQDVIRVRHGLERDLLHDAPRAAVAQRVAQRAHALLRVRHGARVVWIIFDERKRPVDGPEVLFRRHRLVVFVNHAAFGNVRGALKREMQTAVADPEQIPVVAVGRVPRDDGVGEAVKGNLARFGQRRVEHRRVGVQREVRRRAGERLYESACRKRKVAELLADSHIPVGVVLKNQHRGKVLANDPSQVSIAEVASRVMRIWLITYSATAFI